MSSSLPVTPTTPITYKWSNLIMTSGGKTQASQAHTLATFLSSPTVKAQDVEEVLVEFFFRSLISGRRVREWCEDLGRVSQILQGPTLAQPAFRSPLTTTLFPFSPPRYPIEVTPAPPLVPASIFSTISRKQLVDGLVRLSRRLAIPSLSVEGWQEIVIEAGLEYIGRRWRLAVEKHETDLVGGIGLKLLEVEFDLQLRGHPTTSRRLVLPILQRVRFDLGLVTASQLVTRLNSPRHHVPSATTLFNTYLTTRLRAGESPQDLVDTLLPTHDKLSDPTHRDQMIAAVSALGLQFDQPTPISPDKPLPTSPNRIGRRFSLRNRTFGLPSPKWLTHRRHDSSSKLSGIFPASFNSDRRPSLPNFSTTSLLQTLSPTSRSKLSTGPEGVRAATMGYSHHSQLQGILSSPNLLASTLSLIDASNLRPALLGQLLAMKYALSPDPSDDWYLGEGRSIAQRLVSDIEEKVLSTQTQVDEVAELRELFRLPREPNEYPTELQDLLTGEFGNFPVPPPRLSMSSTVDARSRATSFDLDRYFEGISEAGDEDEMPKEEDGVEEDHRRTSIDTLLPNSRRRSSAGVESILSMATGKTGATAKSRGRRSSSHTSFTIQQATRGWTYPAQLVKPRRVQSIDDRTSGRGTEGGDFVPLEEDSGCGSEGESDIEELDNIPAIASFLPPRSNRWSRSEADLIFPQTSPSADLYTRLPNINSLRRRKRMQKPSLSAIDLGLGRQVLTPPGFPRSPPPTDDDLETPTPTATTFSTSSRCAAGPVSFFSPLTSPFSPIRPQAVLPEGYVAPLTPPTSPPQITLDLGSDIPRASTEAPTPQHLSWSPPWKASSGNSSQPIPDQGTSTTSTDMSDDITPRIKRQINRQYRILDGDLSPEKRPSALEDLTPLPVIREDPPTPMRLAHVPQRSPSDSPLSEDWFTAPETPRPWSGNSPISTALSQASDPVKSQQSTASLALPRPPPRTSSLRRLRPSSSQKSLSGVTTWSVPSTYAHDSAPTPAPLDLDGIASHSASISLGSPSQKTSHDQSRTTSSASWTSSESSSSFDLPSPVNPLKSVLGLFIDPSLACTLHPDVTEGHIRFVLEEVLKREMDEKEREHVKWLITKATELIHDPKWHRQVEPYLAIWNPSAPPTPPPKIDILPDLTPRNLSPPKSHPLLSSMPRSPPSQLPWSASSSDMRHSPSSTLKTSKSSSARMPSSSSSALATSTSSSNCPEASLLGKNKGQAALIAKRRMNKFRLSISTFGRRDSFTSFSSPSSTKSQTLYEALRG